MKFTGSSTVVDRKERRNNRSILYYVDNRELFVLLLLHLSMIITREYQDIILRSTSRITFVVSSVSDCSGADAELQLNAAGVMLLYCIFVERSGTRNNFPEFRFQKALPARGKARAR